MNHTYHVDSADRIIATPINENRAVRTSVALYAAILVMGLAFIIGFLGRAA